jgi:hypothetical protein
MKATLANGVVIEGTLDQIQTAAKAYGLTYAFEGDGVHYKSASRGLIRIKDMDDTHLRNAMFKMLREWAASLNTLPDDKLLVNLRNGNQDRTFLSLANEFMTRMMRNRGWR